MVKSELIFKVIMHGRMYDIVKDSDRADYVFAYSGMSYEMFKEHPVKDIDAHIILLKETYDLASVTNKVGFMANDDGVVVTDGDDITVGANNQTRPVDGEEAIEMWSNIKDSKLEGVYTVDELLDMGFEAGAIIACLEGKQKTHKKKRFKRPE